MKTYPEKLGQQNLAQFSAYLIVGDEPLLKRESIDTVRQQLQAQNLMEERQRFSLDAEFSWEALFAEFNALSLFSQNRLIEVHFEKAPDKAQQQQLAHLLSLVNHETRLLLSFPKLTKNSEKQAWYKAVDSSGVIVTIYPPEGPQLLNWVRQRIQLYRLAAPAELTQLLIHYYEGNLLALDQALQSIALQWPNQQLKLHEVEQGLVQASRFNSFQLIDALLAGDHARALHVCKQLQLEGEEASLVNWGLEKEFRLLNQLLEQPTQQHATLFKKNGVWSKRQSLFRQACKLYKPAQLALLWPQLAAIDSSIKQFSGEQAWLEVERAILLLASPHYASA